MFANFTLIMGFHFSLLRHDGLATIAKMSGEKRRLGRFLYLFPESWRLGSPAYGERSSVGYRFHRE